MNNMNSNKPTVVERYIVTETENLIYDADALASWKQACEALGLVGQQKLTAQAVSPVPFLFMNTGLEKTIHTLCPSTTPVDAYDKTPIPLEVLDLVALSMREGYFKRIEVWYDDKLPDPVVVGIDCVYIPVLAGWKYLWEQKFQSKEACKTWMTENNQQAYSETTFCTDVEVKKYLLARWGDVAKPLDQLREEAIQRHLTDERAKLQAQLTAIQCKLEDLTDAVVRATFN
jgi:hypothetical protein